jgi:hypothetical protein
MSTIVSTYSNQLNNNINDTLGSLMTQLSLHQLITEPTYVTEHSSSLLDLILVSNPSAIFLYRYKSVRNSIICYI